MATSIAGIWEPNAHSRAGPGTSVYPTYLPHGAHGCFRRLPWLPLGWWEWHDGVVQKYNPQAASQAGAGATWVDADFGTHGQCDGPPNPGGLTYTSCGDANSFNTSHTLLNEPADIAVDPNPDPATGTTGSVYIADGYGNHRVVVYTTRDGGQSYQYNRQWGTACSKVGQDCPAGTFGKTGGGHPHCVVLGNDGLVYVCDRPNSRIQVFDKSCGAASVSGSQPMCMPRRIINIGLNAGVTPPPHPTEITRSGLQIRLPQLRSNSLVLVAMIWTSGPILILSPHRARQVST